MAYSQYDVHKPLEPNFKGWHDNCAHKEFNVDTSKEGYGSWHHSVTPRTEWHPYLSGVPCESCGKDC